MEKIVNAKILNFFKTNTFLYPIQSGFLPTHSTVTQLAFLVHKWQMALDRLGGESIESVFLDLSKVYDRVSHQGLISKLSTCGFSYSSLEWMSNFVSRCKQCVRLNGTESTWLAPRSGIPVREQLWGRCYFSFTSMIFLLNLRVVVLFSLMTPRYMQPVLTPNSVVQESQPIWMLLQNGQTVGACS